MNVTKKELYENIAKMNGTIKKENDKEIHVVFYIPEEDKEDEETKDKTIKWWEGPAKTIFGEQNER